MEFDSKEELYISWWLDELKDRGMVIDYTKSKTIPLSKANKELKLREHSYTPDFHITWSDEAKKLFDFKLVSLWEVKGNFDAQNMTRLFKLNQKWVFDKYGIFVDLVKPEELFKKTFCPNRFRLTDSGKAQRKLKTEYLTLDEYIQQYTDKQQDDRKGVQSNRKRKLQ